MSKHSMQVCQHHAAAVADGSGCTQILKCSYHGWEYGETHILLTASSGRAGQTLAVMTQPTRLQICHVHEASGIAETL